MSDMLSVSVSEKLKKELEDTCDSKGINMSEVIRRGIIEQIRDLKKGENNYGD